MKDGREGWADAVQIEPAAQPARIGSPVAN